MHGSPTANAYITEINIPALSNTLGNMQTSQLLASVNIDDKLDTNEKGVNLNSVDIRAGQDGVVLWDLLARDGKIYGSAYEEYDRTDGVNGVNTHSHYVISTDNLSNVTDGNTIGLANVAQGLSNHNLSQGELNSLGIDGTDAGFVSGYMVDVPDMWRSKLGNFDTLGGHGGGSIISRTNSGPGAYLFNRAELGNDNIVVEPVAHYNLTNPYHTSIAPPSAPGFPTEVEYVTALFNRSSVVEGAFFPPNRRSVVFVGLTAAVSEFSEEAEIFYGSSNGRCDPSIPNVPTDCFFGELYYDNSQIYQGEHSVNGNYQYQAWVYDIDDYEDVLNGSAGEGWTNIVPRNVFRFDFGGDFAGIAPSKRIGGVALDQETGRLFITQQMGLSPDDASGSNIVHVYDLSNL